MISVSGETQGGAAGDRHRLAWLARGGAAAALAGTVDSSKSASAVLDSRQRGVQWMGGAVDHGNSE